MEKTTQTQAVTAQPVPATRTCSPRTDVTETAQGWTVVADMPGVSESTVDVVLERNLLTIRGRAETGAPRNGYRLVYAEYETGGYERSFTVPDSIDRDGVTGAVKNGVLTVTLPKTKPAGAKKIAIVQS